MKVPIYRGVFFMPASFGGGDAIRLDPEAGPVPTYSFEPDEHTIDPRGLVGTGPFPWLTIEVPDGSRVAYYDDFDQPCLFVPGEADPLVAVQAFRRFADPNLVQSEKEIARKEYSRIKGQSGSDRSN
jgi:hypothetical protein